MKSTHKYFVGGSESDGAVAYNNSWLGAVPSMYPMAFLDKLFYFNIGLI